MLVNSLRQIFILIALLSLIMPATANEKRKIITVESTVTGSQEQPKILVIVPWQKPEDAVAISNSTTRDRQNNIYLQSLERRSFIGKTKALQLLIEQ